MRKITIPRKTIFIVGLTGSGKSPLGNYLQENLGFAHFDFGHQLRNIVAEDSLVFSAEEKEFISNMLATKSHVIARKAVTKHSSAKC